MMEAAAPRPSSPDILRVTAEFRKTGLSVLSAVAFDYYEPLRWKFAKQGPKMSEKPRGGRHTSWLHGTRFACRRRLPQASQDNHSSINPILGEILAGAETPWASLSATPRVDMGLQEGDKRGP